MNQKLGVFVNPASSRLAAIHAFLAQWPREDELFGWAEQKDHLPSGMPVLDADSASGAGLSAILVFGGDGAILRSTPFSLAAEAPILGFNLGRLGFLTECALKDAPRARCQLIAGDYHVQERMLLDVEVQRAGRIVYSDIALNDAVVFKGASARLLDLRVYCNRKYVLETRCDGIVAASPTGSTAYSLSAGGPIMSPVMEALIVAPLNPHILSVRPMVFGPGDRIMFKLLNELEGTVLQLDGRNAFLLNSDDQVRVGGSRRRVSFIRLSERTFYEVLRKKLHMGKK
jgi:NAD+ kinase